MSEASDPHRDGMSFEEVERRPLPVRGAQFDPDVVDCFLSLARAEMSFAVAAAGASVSAAL